MGDGAFKARGRELEPQVLELELVKSLLHLLIHIHMLQAHVHNAGQQEWNESSASTSLRCLISSAWSKRAATPPAVRLSSLHEGQVCHVRISNGSK